MTDPAPPPLPPPGLPNHGQVVDWRDPRAADERHLRLLWIFHYVYSAAGLLGIGFLVMHYTIMKSVFANPQTWQQSGPNAPPFDPATFFGYFKWFYLAAGGLILVGMAFTLASGWCLQRRKARGFSMVVAGLNCLRLPLGTALGVFTLIVLSRDSVRDAYAEQK